MYWSYSNPQCLVNLSTLIYNLCIGLLKKLENFSTYLSNLYKRLKFKKGNENSELQPSTPTKDDLENCNLDENNCDKEELDQEKCKTEVEEINNDGFIRN